MKAPRSVYEAFGHNQTCAMWSDAGSSLVIKRDRKCTCGAKEATYQEYARVAREETEKLVERGSWVNGFEASRLRQADGTIVDYVQIDPRLKPKKKRVWVFFFKMEKRSYDEYTEHIAQTNIADWRFRRAQ